MRKDRILSLVVVLFYLIGFYGWALVRGLPAQPKDRLGLVIVPAFFLLPLALIWFGDELGDYTGPVPRGYVNEKTPGCLVKLVQQK